MRKTPPSDIKVLSSIVDKEGQVSLPWLVSLGADFCAEHERGIGSLETKLGIGKLAQVGVERRQMTTGDAGSAYYWSNDVEAAFVVGDEWGLRSHIESGAVPVPVDGVVCFTGRIPQSIERFVMPIDTHVQGEDGRFRKVRMPKGAAAKAALFENHAGFQAAWNEKSFMIFARGSGPCMVVADLVRAYVEKDLVVSVGMRMPFQNGGLNLSIASRFPQNVRDTVIESDRDHAALMAFAENTGIHKTLKDAKCRFSALSPKWTNENKNDVIFFLNPDNGLREGKKASYGWVTIQDLRDWAKGTGVIVGPDEAIENEHYRRPLNHDDALIRAEKQLRAKLNAGFSHQQNAERAGVVTPQKSKRPVIEEDLNEAVTQTGIKRLLVDAKLADCVLRPKWLDEEKTDVIFYLNPGPTRPGQKKPHMGWVTVQDLRDWTEDHGVIVDGEKADLYLDCCLERASSQMIKSSFTRGR